MKIGTFVLLTLLSTSVCAQTSFEQKQLEEEFEPLLAKNPTDAKAYFDYGRALANLDEEKNYEKSIALMSRSVRIEEDFNRLFSLGTLCCRVGKFKESLAAYQQILEKRPSLIPVLYNSGYTLKLAGELDLAIELYKQIIAIQPTYEPAHLSLAFSYIQQGDFERGWKEHEWNLKKQGKYAESLRELLRNNTLPGKTILLVPEGGIGDTIHFLRYAQRLHDQGAYVVVAVQPSLVHLLARCHYIDLLIPLRSPTPRHDAYATLMSLPAIFSDTEKTIPRTIPYIFPDPARVQHWHEQLAQDTNFKIGICWQPDVHNDVSRLPIARRGIPLSLFYKLGSTPGISLYSLQKKEGLDQLRTVPSSVNLHVFDEAFDVEHGSFVDTAAVIQEMDLIISADTATAHIAGALGKKVWLLLPYVTDWRWLHNRTDSPWYPTMRIFKQPHPFDWQTMMDELYTVFEKELHKK